MDTAHFQQMPDCLDVEWVDTGHWKANMTDVTTAIVDVLKTASTILKNK